MPISDHHSVEYDFEELQPVIGGVRLDTYISGRAELACDPGYSFYVRSITLDGTVKDMSRRSPLFGGEYRRDAKVTITTPADDDHSEDAALFRLIAKVIDEDEKAHEAWRAEVEEAA